MDVEVSRSLASAHALLADPRFQDILARLAAQGVDRASFDRLPMPAGCSPEGIRPLVRGILRAQGIRYRDGWTIDGVASAQWFYPTRSIELKLRELSRRTGAGSPLDRALSERFGQRFVTSSLIGETVAAVSCEGLCITYEEARRACLGDTVPRRPVERLVANMHALLVCMLGDELPSLDEATIRAMYEQLTQGIDAGDLGGSMAWGDEWPGDPVDSNTAITEVCAMASEELVDPAEHPIVTSQRIVCHFWRNGVFPLCNYVLGSLVCRLYLKQKGYPVFAYLPISQMSLAWRQGTCDCVGVWPYRECCDVQGPDYDWTLYWESCLQLLLHEAEALEETILRVKGEDDEILRSLRADHSFNHRQRALLEQAVLTPSTAMRIEEYRSQHDLAYSTARQDLTSLVERGLLEMRYEGKAQVFTVRDDFKRRLVERYGA